MKRIALLFIIAFIFTACGPRQTPKERFASDFKKNKTKILLKLNTLFNAEGYDPLLSETKKYIFIKDPDIIALRNKATALQLIEQERLALEEEKLAKKMAPAKIKKLLKEVKKVPAAEVYTNRNIYSQLKTLDPDNPKYKKKYEYYKKKTDKLDAERAVRKFIMGKRPVKSSWDGSYPSVKRYLKRVANDPSSIKISGCTKVYTTKDGWLVGCDYRGKNAFGALVRNSNWFIILQNQVVAVKHASAYKP